MNTQPGETTIAEQAARWVGALDREGEPGRAAFVAWLQASPQHVKEFLLASALDRETGRMDFSDLDLDDILASGNSNVIGLERRASEPRDIPPAHRLKWAAGLSATLLATAGGWWMLAGPGSWQTYATAIGEQRTIALDDGSVVELDPASRITVRLNSHRRDVRLTRGEAFFKVERDAERPFEVVSGATVVRVLGTQFAVHQRNSGVTVSVLEGRVEVNHEHILDAGEEVRVTAAGSMQARTLTPAEHSAALRQRSLTFSGETLADIAEDFNRYNRIPQIHIEGEQLRMRQYSGVFDADDPYSLADYLVRVAGLSAERGREKIIIRERR